MFNPPPWLPLRVISAIGGDFLRYSGSCVQHMAAGIHKQGNGFGMAKISEIGFRKTFTRGR